MSRKSLAIRVFEYLDYRTFLQDWYNDAKKNRRGYSFRAFSKQAGFQSPNFFKLVMDGERNLTEDSLIKFVCGLELNKQEGEFFYNLVFFNQASSNEKKDYYYKKLLQSKKFNQLKPIEKGKYEFYSTWYHPVIRELVTAKDFDGTPAWLAKKIRPEVSVQQVEKSLELLEGLGFIRKIKDGHWQQDTPLISTGPESESHILLKYHQNLLHLNADMLEKISHEQRDISALTLGILKERVPQLKKKIQEFRQDVLKLVSDDVNPDEVVIVSIQMMPVTKIMF